MPLAGSLLCHPRLLAHGGAPLPVIMSFVHYSALEWSDAQGAHQMGAHACGMRIMHVHIG